MNWERTLPLLYLKLGVVFFLGYENVCRTINEVPGLTSCCGLGSLQVSYISSCMAYFSPVFLDFPKKWQLVPANMAALHYSSCSPTSCAPLINPTRLRNVMNSTWHTKTWMFWGRRCSLYNSKNAAFLSSNLHSIWCLQVYNWTLVWMFYVIPGVFSATPGSLTS